MFDPAECRVALADWLADLDPAVVAAEDADAALTELAAIANQVHTATVLLAGRALEAGRWRAAGDRSAPAHLARRLGTSVHAAEQLLATASRMADLPCVDAAARAGALSDRQLRVVADAADAAPTREQELVGAARRESFVGLRRVCDAAKAAADVRPDDERHRDAHEARRLRTANRPDGTFHLDLDHTTAAGAELLSLLQPFQEEAFAAARAAGRHEPPEAYGADALLAMARAANGGTAPGTDGGRPGRRVKVIVRIDHAALVRGRAEPGEVCEIAGVGPLPVQAVRELMEDAFVAAVLTDGTEIRRVVHLGRQPTALQRTALEWRDPSCAVDGCSATAHLEIDHTVEWADSHHTTLDELARLCSHHHDLKTFDGWTVETLDDGRTVMRPPERSPTDHRVTDRRAKARRRRNQARTRRRC